MVPPVSPVRDFRKFLLSIGNGEIRFPGGGVVASVCGAPIKNQIGGCIAVISKGGFKIRSGSGNISSVQGNQVGVQLHLSEC